MLFSSVDWFLAMVYWNTFGEKWPTYLHVISMVATGILEVSGICGGYHKSCEAAVIEVESKAVICENLDRNGLTGM